MDITEDNYVAGLQAKNEKALKFFIEHDGWIVKSIVHKMMAKYQDKQEECMNDIFLAVWKNVDRYTGENASFRTWLTAVARYQVLSHIRDIRYHDYVSLDDVEPVGDSDVKSRLFDEEEMLEFQKLLEILSEEDRQIFTALFWHEKSYEEVGQEMNMPVDKVREILKIAQEPVSLETPIGEEEDSHLGDFIPDEGASEPSEAASFTLLKEQLMDVLSTLTPREEKVLKLRFGIEDGRTRTLEEVGKEFNVTRERIRQIEAKALRKLRHPSRSKKLKDFLN